MEKRKENSGGGKKKKSSYKLKRSFTRNKKIRTESPDGFKKPFKKSDGSEFEEKPKRKIRPGAFDKDKREDNKEKRSDRKEQFARKSKKSFSKDSDFKGASKSRPWEKGDKKGFSKGIRSDKNPARSSGGEKTFDRGDKKPYGGKDAKGGFLPYERKRPAYKKDYSSKPGKEKETYAEKGLTRLNKYIANAGICSRREADDLITTGCVSVNGKVVTELGYKVKEGDEVNYSGQRLKTEKHVYVLLNKPKDYITTVEDDRDRRTVMELIKGACKERVYPVGRLDRNTMGLLLFTNDGEMTKKLTHPKHRVQKLYHVELDKNLKQTDLEKIQNGIELEDGFIKPDEVSYAGETKREVGILIHSGRNRIVRRIFEQLGYDVLRLDRIMFAGLTKKDLPRGRWRILNEKEVAFLKMI